MKHIILMTALTIFVGSVSMAENESLKADREAVASACAAESKTAGCGDDKVTS